MVAKAWFKLTLAAAVIILVGLAVVQLGLRSTGPVVNAQQYNITPYNTLYVFAIMSPPLTSISLYNPNIFHGGIAWYGVVQSHVAAINYTTGEEIPILAKNWTLQVLPNGSLAIYITLRHSGMSNGQPITCWDLLANNIANGLIHNMWGNVSIINNYTCVFRMPEGYYAPPTSPAAEAYDVFWALNWGGVALDWTFNAWYPLMEATLANYSWLWLFNFGNATQQAEARKVLTPLINELFTATLPPNTPTTGPFYVCDITPEYILLCKNPYFYAAKDIKVDYIVEWQYSSMTQVYAALASGKISIWNTGPGSLSPSIIATILSNPNMKMFTIPWWGGDALYFNFLNPWLAMPQVRQAIYYAVNWTQLAQAAYGPQFILPSPMPQVGIMNDKYPSLVQQVISYWASQGSPLINYTYNPDEAAKLLESVGFTKKGGVWYTPNGSEFTLTLYIGSGAAPPQLALVNSIANALTSFGIPTTVTVYPSSEFSTIVQKGQYDIMFQYYDGAPEPGLPSFFPEGPIPAAYFQGYPFNVTHWNMVITLPNGTQVSPLQACYKYQLNPARTFSCYAISMWAWNHYVPFIQIDRNTQVFFINTQYINWPLNDTSIWSNLPSIQTEAWTTLLTHISFKTPTATATTTSTTTSTAPATVTKVVTPSYVLYAVVAVVVVVVVAAAVAIILMRRR
ncbi:ABC transporter substrate-binding protein [Caldivirga sp.]|uniref:ABC transporter substrate-binding protein n=1 Tax=Caldivirga sp. TaxID=2080243 RepID=UPI0025C51931|nr:ABC transporter substrate-binding protein [Caldivirga sp.]